MPHPRRHPAGVAVALTAALAMPAVMLAGCTAMPEVRPSTTLTPFPTTHASTPAGTGIGSSMPPSSDAWDGRSMLCPVPVPVAEHGEQARLWSPPQLPPGATLEPKSPPMDGAMLTDVHSRTFTGTALVDAATGHLRPLKAFAHPDRDQSGGAFDGEHALWTETHSLQTLDDFSVYSYDTATGTRRHLGDASRDSHGNVYPSPWQDPVVQNGLGAWVQGTSPTQRALTVVTLATGRTRVVARGWLGAARFVGDTLVYLQADHGPTGATLHAVNPATGRPSPLPPALAAAGPVAYFAGSPGGKVAWIDATMRQLWFAPTPTSPAHLVAQLPGDYAFAGDLTLTDDALMYSQQGKGSQYVDLTTGNTFTAGTSLLFFLGANGKVLTVDASDDKAAPLRVHLLDVPPGTVTGCRHRAPTPALLTAGQP